MASTARLSFTVSGTDPKTRRFHGESCATLEQANARAEELKRAGYKNVTVTSKAKEEDEA